MDSSRDSEFDARLGRIETAIAGLERSVERLIAERPSTRSQERAERGPFVSYSAGSAASGAASFPQQPFIPPPERDALRGMEWSFSSWVASRSPEWWLSRVGIGFLVLGVLLLYAYAVEHDWITPPVRVATGAAVGGLLLWGATRVRPPATPGRSADLGLRDLLFGGALAIWYVTAYAAAVWYQLIPVGGARLVFFVLGIVSTWIALEERREIFGLLAVVTGFATPFILPAPATSMTELSLYLGAVTAIGLIIYLMRGWRSIIWITFLAFWMSVATPAYAQQRTIVLDPFDSVSHWTTNAAPGVEITIHSDSNGANGRAMRLDFDFHGNPGYAIVHRALDVTLPWKYAFSFAIRGIAPPNTLEFKLIDSTGANVWWSNTPFFPFPRDWWTITRAKEQIYFAWGPTEERHLKKVAALEFAVTAGSGGKGSIWIDDLTLRITNPPAHGSIPLSILLIVAGAAFTRAPILLRKLLTLNSPRYTATPPTSADQRRMEGVDALSARLGGGKSALDSIVLWVLTLGSAVLVIGFLSQVWPQLPHEVWGAGFLLLGLAAFGLFRRGSVSDPEIAHVTLTAATLWTLIGAGVIAPMPENMVACAVVAAFIISFAPRQLAGARVLAKLAMALALLNIATHELWSVDTGVVHLRWLVSGIVTLGAATFTARQLVADSAEEKQGIVLAGATYITGLIVVRSALNPIWPPLVTTSFAIIGAALLILSRRPGARPLLRHTGGVTMLIVVARLLLVDFSSVETIWRVLLFLVAGAVFLYTAYRMQPRTAPAEEK